MRGWAVAIAMTWMVGCGARSIGDLPADFDDFDGGAVRVDAGHQTTCPPGGPTGATPLLLGPSDERTGLWRVLRSDEGEGQAFTVPRSGVIDRVEVQLFSPYSSGKALVRLFRFCEGERVLAASAELSAAAFPVYAIDHGGHRRDQNLRLTSFRIDPPFGVTAGERVDAVFSAIETELVSGIHMQDVDPDSRIVFYNDAPGIPDPDSADWDFLARLQLK